MYSLAWEIITIQWKEDERCVQCNHFEWSGPCACVPEPRALDALCKRAVQARDTDANAPAKANLRSCTEVKDARHRTATVKSFSIDSRLRADEKDVSVR